MLVRDIILEKEEPDNLGNRIINLLKKTPSVNSPIAQYKNDPNQVHKTARSNFRSWCKRQGLKYVVTNTMKRGGPATTRIAFYAFIGMMQKECGMSPTGILDVRTMKTFVEQANRFSDSYISSRVESTISSSSFKVPRNCIDVVKAIENPDNSWSSTYATYHDITGRLDFGIGPGQVEPNTYGDIGGSFDFGNLEHTTSIARLTNIMLETIQHKMPFADRIAKKQGRSVATLEDFARAWNPINYDKAQKVYGKGIPMRDEVKGIKPPLDRPAELDPDTPTDIPKIDKKSVDGAVQKALEPKDKQGYMQKIKKGFGNILRGDLDSEG